MTIPNAVSAQAEAMGTLADDLLRGVKSISVFINENPRRTFYLLENKLIPAGKQGNSWVASRRALRDHYTRLTAGSAA
jgi:hypothetical protein